MVGDREACAEAYSAAGSAVECALKALIMRVEGLNGWPDPDIRPDLHKHTLWSLAHSAGVDLSARNPIAASWLTVLEWKRAGL